MKTEKIASILEPVARKVNELIHFERFYVVMFEQHTQKISFPFMKRGDNIVYSPWEPRDLKTGILPDQVVILGEGLLVENKLPIWLEKWGNSYWPDWEDVPQSWLGVPVVIGEQTTIGALVIENWQETAFFTEDNLRLLETVARQTSNAIENARLWSELELKISSLKILNKVGQRIMNGLAKKENEILDLIYQSASELNLDTSDMYITFYDPDPEITDTTDVIYGHLRFALSYDEGNRSTIPDRPARNGLTEYVIRTKESLNPIDVKRAYQEIAQDQIGKIPRSWRGVPMIAEGKVFGVIVLRNNELEQAYTTDDQEILEILAGQAAISLLNLRYYEALARETEQKILFEKTAVMSNMAAEFAHKMNNIAGTIPVRVSRARAELNADNARDRKVLNQLDKIDSEVKNLLYAAQEIRESIELGEVKVTEPININDLLDIATIQAITSHINVEDKIVIKKNYGRNLPNVKLDRKALLDTLTSIIKNGCEAIHEKGTVTIGTRLGSLGDKAALEVEIEDTGTGIPPTDLPKIFDLFYTTKGDQGLGFGLWRDKVFLKNIGGDIDVLSELNKGTVFTLRIPLGINQN